MDYNPNTFAEPLADLPLAAWRTKLAQIASDHGAFVSLSADHVAALIRKGSTLLVSFELQQGIRALHDDAQPLGWDLVQSLGWSHLCIVSNGATWGRDPALFNYFDTLTDEGFFDAFSTVVFYGAGPCGYAAAAFSVAAPGARVVTIQPQATLDPDITGWDQRFLDERRRSFTGRYAYAPDMLDAAEQAFIVFDPMDTMDAMHAALFTKPHVTKLPMRYFGTALQTDLLAMNLLHRVLVQAAAGKLTRTRFAKLMRARRSYIPYLRSLLNVCDTDARDGLAIRLCRHGGAHTDASIFAKRLRDLEEAPAPVS